MSYFVYVISVGPLQMLESHVVEGPELSVKRTRELICSGAQVRDLMFVSEVMSDNETHHARRNRAVLDRTAEGMLQNAAAQG